MNTYFIYSNIKVNTLHPNDGPFPGFKLVTYENESWTMGTLIDIGVDAGFTNLGHHRVYGQLWRAEDPNRLYEFEDIIGIRSGFNELIKIPVEVESEGIIDALTYRIKNLPKPFEIIPSGRWSIKKS